MHLGNGAITPECVALTYTAAAAGVIASAAAANSKAVLRITATHLRFARELSAAILNGR